MRKLTKAVLALLMVFAIVLTVVPDADISAKSSKITNKQAQTILGKKVKNKFCRYAYEDIDMDGIDELIVWSYSGKFVDGCDKKKTVSIYKVVNGKAKELLSGSVKGDFYHPYMGCAIYYADTLYVALTQNHEGYLEQTVYKYNKNKFSEIASLALNADGTGYYRIGGKGKNKEFDSYDVSEYEDVLEGFNDYRIELSYKTCTNKVANKYLKKMLKSEYDYRCKIGYYGKKITTTAYEDLDGDGISELVVTTGAKSGEVLYASMSSEDYEYYTGSTEYTIVDGQVVFAVD